MNTSLQSRRAGSGILPHKRRFALQVCRSAAKELSDARCLFSDIYCLYLDGNDSLEKQVLEADCQVLECERRLIECLLRVRGLKTFAPGSHPIALMLDGTEYVVIPASDEWSEPRLVIVAAEDLDMGEVA